MAMVEEEFCNNDTDCSSEQYCYNVSKRCVDYTQCSRYNRQENREKRSRHPSQCGPCLSTYTAEKLGTGEMAWLCRKTNTQQSIPEGDTLDNRVIIYTAVALMVICISAVIGILFKKRTSKRQASKTKQCGELCVVEPTAPPLENSPFIDCSEKSSPVFNNNKNLKDKNNLVRAAGFIPPDWVRTNPNYENDLNNDSINSMEQLHSMSELPTNEQSSSWTPEQLTLEVTNANLVGYEIEQIDNNLNTVLVQTNNPSSNSTQEENNNNNNNNTNNGSTSESSNTQSSRERVRASNIMISQKISMNVNVLNGDC